ncbi:MFS transporter, partial [Xanthomonas vasicola pv. musacearum NCPPB 4384]
MDTQRSMLHLPTTCAVSGAHWAAHVSRFDGAIATTHACTRVERRTPSHRLFHPIAWNLAAMTVSAAPAEGGAWAPLREPVFRALWLAILGSNIGTWINDVAASWVMAEQTGSPLMVAAVQSATTLPVVLFALVAGTLADIVDRRRYLMFTQGWMLLVAGTLAMLAHLQLLTPWLLVALTFAMGM